MRAFLLALCIAGCGLVHAQSGDTATCPAPATTDDAPVTEKSDSVAADDPRPVTLDQSVVRDTMKKILAGPDFSPEEITKVPVFKKKDSKREKTPEWIKSLEAFFRAVAEFGRVIVWILIAAGVIALLVGLHYWWRMTAGRTSSRVIDLPTRVGGLDIRPESLPDDIGAAAREAWQQGNAVTALSLLYRGALSALVLRFGVAIRSSYTEQECLRATKRGVAGGIADYFTRLTQAWVHAVYARRLPADAIALALCDEFNGHFARPQVQTEDGLTAGAPA
jgi:hypothetical protein